MIFDHAERTPDALALDDFTRRRSWAELAERATRAAHLYRACGLAPGDHAALLLSNRVEFVEMMLGALLAGLWITPINWHLAPDEIAYVVADSGARLLISDPENEAPARQTAAPRLLLAGPELDEALASVSAGPVDLEAPAGGPMMYTSGTTGRPKGVKRRRAPSARAAFAGHASSAHAIGLDGSGPHLVTGPLYHAAPGMFAIYELANGAPMLILPRFDAREFLRVVEERRVRHTHLVPTMFVRLLRLPEEERERFDPSSLEVVLHGAAPISVAAKRRMIEWWGPILVEYWGGTEGGVATLVGSEDWLAHPGTVGRAVPHYEVFAVDDAGRRLPPGQEGALYSRHLTTPRIFEYHAAPEKTASAYLDDSAFTLGDVGWVDEEGWLYLSDRRSNTIISGGVNIYPAEIEQVLQEHPAVADVGVFGIPDEEWGEQVKAAVELEAGFEPGAELERELLGFTRQRLAGFKVPRSIDFEAELPRTPAGKLVVRRLREPYWQGRQRRI